MRFQYMRKPDKPQFHGVGAAAADSRRDCRATNYFGNAGCNADCINNFSGDSTDSLLKVIQIVIAENQFLKKQLCYQNLKVEFLNQKVSPSNDSLGANISSTERPENCLHPKPTAPSFSVNPQRRDSSSKQQS